MNAALIHKSVNSRLLGNVRIYQSNISPGLSHFEQEVLRAFLLGFRRPTTAFSGVFELPLRRSHDDVLLAPAN